MANWVGKPDTFAARSLRKAEDEAKLREEQGLPPIPIAKNIPGGGSGTRDFGSGEEDELSLFANTKFSSTDWEKFQFEIQLHFIDEKTVLLSMNGQESLEREWKIISTSPSNTVVEIRTPDVKKDEAKETENDTAENDSKEPKKSSEAAQPKVPEVRRFIIRFEGEKKDRFTLSEDGADPYVGSLLFRRPEKNE